MGDSRTCIRCAEGGPKGDEEEMLQILVTHSTTHFNLCAVLGQQWRVTRHKSTVVIGCAVVVAGPAEQRAKMK
jgi:hypothetical protein